MVIWSFCLKISLPWSSPCTSSCKLTTTGNLQSWLPGGRGATGLSLKDKGVQLIWNLLCLPESWNLIYELLEHVKGLVLQIQSCRIHMTQGNNGISERSLVRIQCCCCCRSQGPRTRSKTHCNEHLILLPFLWASVGLSLILNRKFCLVKISGPKRFRILRGKWTQSFPDLDNAELVCQICRPGLLRPLSFSSFSVPRGQVIL